MTQKLPSGRIYDLHIVTMVNCEIPAAIARIADETCELWPGLDLGKVIEQICRAIGHEFQADQRHWQTVARAAKGRSRRLNKKVQL